MNFGQNPPIIKQTVQRQRHSYLAVDSPLRHSGLHISLVHAQEKMTAISQTNVCVGFCVSFWLTLLSISVELGIINAPQQDGWSLRLNLRVQNRVSLESPLMKACQQGDIPLVCQVLEDGRGGINDRTICSGKTALLVSPAQNQRSGVLHSYGTRLQLRADIIMLLNFC
jgi:hypothetical protein